MYRKLSETINEVVQFTNKHRIDAKFNIHTISDLKGGKEVPDEYWATFEKLPGVYVFFCSDESNAHYVGMSEKDVGSRLYFWLFKENKVNDALKSDDYVLTISLPTENYMAPALESFLINKLKPRLNVRNAV